MQLQALFTSRVVAELARHGKRPLLWDEALEMGALLPEEVTVDVWRDWLRDPSCPEGYCPEGELPTQSSIHAPPPTHYTPCYTLTSCFTPMIR